LERAALRLDDVRLRPAVVHNFLLLLHQLHGHHGEPPATFAQVAELLARVSPEERLRRCLQRVAVDTSKDTLCSSPPSPRHLVLCARGSRPPAAMPDVERLGTRTAWAKFNIFIIFVPCPCSIPFVFDTVTSWVLQYWRCLLHQYVYTCTHARLSHARLSITTASCFFFSFQ
jgi:hypothetical protein